ncbi:hypothetical protein ACLKA6_004167 [Drosophila palustris]
MQVKVFALLAIILVAQKVEAGTITFGGLMGDISKVAVSGEKLIHQLENQLEVSQPETSYMEPDTQNLLGDMANALGQLANTITHLRIQPSNVKPQPRNLIGDALGDMGNALGDLANTITKLSVEIKSEPQTRSLSTSGAAIIGELGSISAKTIATAANEAAPYIKKLNADLGNLANGITHL